MSSSPPCRGAFVEDLFVWGGGLSGGGVDAAEAAAVYDELRQRAIAWRCVLPLGRALECFGRTAGVDLVVSHQEWTVAFVPCVVAPFTVACRDRVCVT